MTAWGIVKYFLSICIFFLNNGQTVALESDPPVRQSVALESDPPVRQSVALESDPPARPNTLPYRPYALKICRFRHLCPVSLFLHHTGLDGL